MDGHAHSFLSLLLSSRADGTISTLLCKLHCLITTLMHVLRCHQTTRAYRRQDCNVNETLTANQLKIILDCILIMSHPTR